MLNFKNKKYSICQKEPINQILEKPRKSMAFASDQPQKVGETLLASGAIKGEKN